MKKKQLKKNTILYLSLTIFFISIVGVLLFAYKFNFLKQTNPRAGLGEQYEYTPVVFSQNHPTAIYNSLQNQFLILFDDCRNHLDRGCEYGSGAKQDIYGQIINANGSCAGGNFPIAITNLGSEYPDGAYNPDKNEYLLAWQEHKKTFTSEGEYQQQGYDIVGQRLSADGKLVGDKFKISPKPIFNNDIDDNQWHPRISYSPIDKKYFVTWYEYRSRGLTGYTNYNNSYKDIYGQIIDGNGNLIGDNFIISYDPNNTTVPIIGNAKRLQQYVDIVYIPDNNRFFMVWEDDRLNSGEGHFSILKDYDKINTDTFGSFWGIDGKKIGDNFLISQTPDKSERYPRVAYNPTSKKILVVWQEVEADKTINHRKAFGQFLDINGQLLETKFLIESNSLDQTQNGYKYRDSESPPHITVSAIPNTENFLISWSKGIETANSWNGDIYTAIVNHNSKNISDTRKRVSSKLQVQQIYAFNQSQYLLLGAKYAGKQGGGSAPSMVYSINNLNSTNSELGNCNFEGGYQGPSPFPVPTVMPTLIPTPILNPTPVSTPTPTNNPNISPIKFQIKLNGIGKNSGEFFQNNLSINCQVWIYDTNNKEIYNKNQLFTINDKGFFQSSVINLAQLTDKEKLNIKIKPEKFFARVYKNISYARNISFVTINNFEPGDLPWKNNQADGIATIEDLNYLDILNPNPIIADVNLDGKVDIADKNLVIQSLNKVKDEEL